MIICHILICGLVKRDMSNLLFCALSFLQMFCEREFLYIKYALGMQVMEEFTRKFNLEKTRWINDWVDYKCWINFIKLGWWLY